MRRRLWLFGLLFLACENAGSGRVLFVDLSGNVAGIVVFDVNGNDVSDVGDGALPGATLEIVRPGSGAVVASTVTLANGAFEFDQVPVGQYQFRIDSASTGDTVVVGTVSLGTFTIEPGDSLTTTVTVRYPFATTAEIRASAVGRRVFLQGVALTPLGVFGDTAVQVVDTSGSIRVTRVRPSAISVGDSIRFLGRRNIRDGQPTLDDVTVFPLSVGVLPTAIQISTAVATSAQSGTLDAVLVGIMAATVTDTATVTGDYHVTSDDGSGPVLVVISPNVGLFTGAILPDSILDVTGVLVPDGGGTWQLKPRVATDVVVR